MKSRLNTDLIIVGAGASGLMGGVVAGELGLSCILLEGRHRPGLKLLMCGNNRCNLTNSKSAGEMADAYGEPLTDFLTPAIRALSPGALRDWFAERALRTSAHQDGRVFPASERADDVLHFFTDALRALGVPLALNAGVTNIRPLEEGLLVSTQNFEISAANVLVATGGVSYPKTGSRGDGQRFARGFGHKITPFRPGLAGIVLPPAWRPERREISLPDTKVNILENGKKRATTHGEILLARQCARGPAMVNASRLISRLGINQPELEIDLFPDLGEDEVNSARQIFPRDVPAEFVRAILRSGSPKHWRPEILSVRPLKEAMVTVGGVALDEIEPETLESKRQPGLFFAGEVMDVDGPTGGYNLHAAFATAQLAVRTIAGRTANLNPPDLSPQKTQPPGKRNKKRQRRRAR